MRLWIGRIIVYTLAIVWGVAGIAKLVSISLPALNQSPVPPWSAQFPVALIVLVAIVEIILAIMLIAGHRKQGLIGGLILLTGFAAMVALFPPTPAQTCGCLGDLALLDADAMLSHIILLLGLHTLGYAMVEKILPNHKRVRQPNSSCI